MHLENTLHQINKIYQDIRPAIEEESSRKLAFFDTLLKRNNGKISVLVNRKLAYRICQTTKQVVQKVLPSPFLMEHNPLSPVKIT